MEANEEIDSTDLENTELAGQHEPLDNATAQDKLTETSNNIMTTSVDNESLGSQLSASGNGSDTDSWTLIEQDEETKDQEKMKIELFANRDLAVFARAAVQALELTESLSKETIGLEHDKDTTNIQEQDNELSPNTSKGHTTDSDIETIDEIHEEINTERTDTPPPAWSSLFSQSVSQQEEEEGRESMATINSDGIPVVEDSLIPDGNNYIWSREEGIHSEDDDETEEPFSTIIKNPATSSNSSLSSELTESAYSESELPEDFPTIVKGHTYAHIPNKQLNIVLSVVVILGVATVFGLGIGHFLGWSERLELQEQYANLREEELEEMTDNLVSCMTGEEGNGGDDPDLEDRIIKQLNEENNSLKSELDQYKKQL